MHTNDGFECDRCFKPARAHGMSYFNTEDCCLDCLRAEKQHPDYERARAVESDHVLRGDTNFPGVGKPSDL